MSDRRTALRQIVGAGLSIPLLRPAAVLAQSSEPYLRYVAPELRKMGAELLGADRRLPAPSLATLDAQRQFIKQWARPRRPDVPVRQVTVTGLRGNPQVVIHVINAQPGKMRPAVLHTHGGGFVTGSAEQSVPDLQDLSVNLGCVAVTVEYRLAPETTYAGSIEDNYAALKWLHDNAATLGVDPARIAVMGESAGGGHAALLAITARDRGEVPVCFQCLVYPMLDDRTGSSRAVSPSAGGIGWNAAANRFGWQSFLGMRPGGASAPRGAVPARVANLAGLPPAWIGVGGIDLFCDEDVDYAQRLNAAGVPTELVLTPGAFHGFDMIAADTGIAKRFTAAKLDALRRGLGIAG